MARKRNPLAAVSVLACAKRVPGLVGALMATMEQELQRAAGGWQAEWGALRETLALTGSAAAWGRDLLGGLEAHPERIRERVGEREVDLGSAAQLIERALAGRRGEPRASESAPGRGRGAVSPVELAHSVSGPEDAPVLLLGGSLGTRLEMWEPQVRALSDRLRLVAFDHRGHGGSPAPEGPYELADLGSDVLALMDRLELDRASFCGLSIGGMVGQWLAVHAPRRLERLVLLCTAARVPSPDLFRERAEAVRRAGGPEAVADAVVERWFTPGFARAHPEVVARHRAMIVATPAEGYAACCEAVAGMDLRADLAGVRVPTLVAAGAQDASIPPEHGRAIADRVPGARFELLDPAAHLMSVERAEEVSGLIAEHLGVKA